MIRLPPIAGRQPPAAHLVLARDILECPTEWAAYCRALQDHGFSIADGMERMLADLGGEGERYEGPLPDAPRPNFNDVAVLCREALRHSHRWLVFAIRIAGPGEVAMALRTSTRLVEDGGDPRWFF